MKIRTLRENLIKKREFLHEMPHIEYGNASLDLAIEKYPTSLEEKKRFINAYETVGIFAYAEKYKKWLRITKQDISTSKQPTPTDVILPKYWQQYARWSIS